MTLEEFRTKAEREVAYFFENWRDENKESPDGWPMEMDESDWWEQLITGLTNSEGYR